MPFDGQIAGHGEVMQLNRKIMKPLQPPPRGIREIEFYTEVQNSNEEDDLQLREWLPKFYGVTTMESR